MNALTIGPLDLLKLIQAATAPVVLISGVGLLLLTLTTRLGRIVDRTRLVAAECWRSQGTAREALEHQLAILRRRARLIRLALALCASSVGAVTTLIGVLFGGLLMGWNVTLACVLIFAVALLCLMAAMFVFVRELFDSLTALDLSTATAPQSRD